jgi:hypothetical protein
LQGEIYGLDTTDFSKINTEQLLSRLEKNIVAPIHDSHSRLESRLLAKLWFRQK